MRIIGVQCRVSPFLIAVVLLLPLSPALATGQPDAPQATIQGSRFPGMPVPSTETTRDRRRGPVEVTFTKWRTAVLPPPGDQIRFLFKGIVGGDLGAGDLVAEVLDRKVSTATTAFAPRARRASHRPPSPDQSLPFTQSMRSRSVSTLSRPLIQGGTNGVTGAALLDGVILAGWRTGAQVHVEFQTVPGTISCVGAPSGATCFQGTIRIERAPKE